MASIINAHTEPIPGIRTNRQNSRDKISDTLVRRNYLAHCMTLHYAKKRLHHCTMHTVLYCTALHCTHTALKLRSHCTALTPHSHCILHCTLLDCTALYSHCTALYSNCAQRHCTLVALHCTHTALTVHPACSRYPLTVLRSTLPVFWWVLEPMWWPVPVTSQIL
jgi:hypothetical protein